MTVNKKSFIKVGFLLIIVLIVGSILAIQNCLIKYPRGNEKIPYYNQKDVRWGKKLYGKTDTIKNAGCGPTCLAMIISGITGRKDINPKIIADWSVENGNRAEGNGSYWSLMIKGGQAFGLNVENVSRKDTDKILKSLQEGKVIIVSVDKGKIASGGHFIVLRGITKKGKILMYDPNSILNSKKEWDSDIIFNESSTNGGEAGKPFWIFDKR